MKTLKLNSREDEILNIAIEHWNVYDGENRDSINEELAFKSTTLAAVSQLLSDMRQDPTWMPGCHQREVLAIVRNVRSQVGW